MDESKSWGLERRGRWKSRRESAIEHQNLDKKTTFENLCFRVEELSLSPCFLNLPPPGIFDSYWWNIARVTRKAENIYISYLKQSFFFQFSKCWLFIKPEINYFQSLSAFFNSLLWLLCDTQSSHLVPSICDF